MKIEKAGIPGLLVIYPDVYRDDRGYFFESYNIERLRDAGFEAEFKQDNESCSSRGVIRGLHLQAPPFTQGKLVRVVSGSVIDVAVDLRKKSPHFGRWYSIFLSATEKKMFWIPEGFAHGFAALEDNTILNYKCTEVYHPEAEICLLWNDPVIAIDWKTENPLVSGRDQKGMLFSNFCSPF